MGGKSGSKSSGQRVTRYSMDLHMGLARSMDALLELRADGKKFYWGSVSANRTFSVEWPNLFGGDEKEGGLVGTLQVLFGGATQAVYEPLRTLHGDLCPAFRGCTTLHYSGQVSTNSAYLKPWEMMFRRVKTAWDGGLWYGDKAEIKVAGGVVAMNPAHIIYEALTNTEWGGGIARSQLDDASFCAAADLYYGEGFGLCFLWQREEAVGEFVQRVLDHVGASRYVSRSTGKIMLASIRGGYDVDDIPLFDHLTGLLSIEDDQTSTAETAINQMTVTWYDVLNDVERTVTRDNPALIVAAGGRINSQSVTYRGLCDERLADQVCQRDLNAAGVVRRFKVQLGRRAGRQVVPAGLFRIRSPFEGIEDMVLRAGDCVEQSDGTFMVTALQDVFGLPDTQYSESSTTWTPADTALRPVEEQRAAELSWRDLVRMLSPADLSYVKEDAAYLATIARNPGGLAADYLLYTRWPKEEFALRGDATWCPSAQLLDPLEPRQYMARMAGDLSQALVGTAALIGDEVVRVDAVDAAAGTVMLGRGCVDTVPQPHAMGARVWFADNLSDVVAVDTREYTQGDSVEAVLLPRGSSSVLPIAQAAPMTVALRGRQGRPYAPGQVRINGLSVLDPLPALSGVLRLTLAHRNRLAQSDLLIDHEAGPMTPEPGVTYRAELFDSLGAQLLSQVFDGAPLALDVPGLPAEPHRVTLTLTTQRNGLQALAVYRCSFDWTPPEPLPAAQGET